MEKISYGGQTLTRWKVGPSTFLAWPEHGARLLNWNVTLGDGSVRDVIYWPENADFAHFPKVRGGNPILFPFAGRSFDQGEINFWRDAAGVRRPMPMHGLTRQGQFELVRCDARGFAARFVPGDEAKEAYPFDYELTVTYRFDAVSLSCEMALRNRGKAPLPWSPGHHFYFTVPWAEGTRRSDYLIRIPAGLRSRQAPTGELVAKPAGPAEENLANPDLIDLQFRDLRSNEVVFGEKGKPGDIVVTHGTAKVPPADATFITWSESDEAPFYCVEPWMGPPNAQATKIGLQYVKPGATGLFSVSVAVK